MLKRARKAVAKRSNVELILGDWPEAASNLPTVDAVVLNMVLHHLPAPASAIRAAAEQLQAGGTLLIPTCVGMTSTGPTKPAGISGSALMKPTWWTGPAAPGLSCRKASFWHCVTGFRSK